MKKEIEILKKYLNGAIIDENDKKIVEQLWKINLIHIGVMVDLSFKPFETAKTTYLGRNYIEINEYACLLEDVK